MKEVYEIKYLSNLNDDKLIELLKSSWGLDKNEPIKVVAELRYNRNSKGRYHNRIYNVKLFKTLEDIEYPIKELDEDSKIQNDGIYTPHNFDKKYLKTNIVCQLELSSKEEREKHENPLLLNVIPESIESCKNIDKSQIIYDKNNNILITETIYNTIKNNSLKQIEEDTKLANEKLTLIKNKIKDKEEFLKKFEKEKQDEINTKLKTIENKIKDKEDDLEKIKDDIKDKKKQKKELSNLIKELSANIEKMEEGMAKKLEKFRDFVKDKAEQLLKLEFIDEEEYNNLLMIKNENEDENLKSISFKDDLKSNYQKAISHIHYYLFNKNIIYPRYIIEDFMALIQTNDLIVLAGESGAGKTNLVKSFAKAIGGKSFIIPVKPNWTSAEDLLGYYNPIEKKYLATPFLEALLEAQNNPDIPYFICLDEMNLARVEYYFADFLSLLEERGDLPEIQLYSDDESSHILSEFKNVLEIINSVKDKYQKGDFIDFVSILKDEEVNNELKRIFGFSDKDSLIKYHTDLRKMINGILNTPSSIKFPKNVRIIGAINIDETTHYLSPKILDRAHIMKFDSPLLYDWMSIANEIEKNRKKDYILKFEIDELGLRENYPSYDRDDEFCKMITEMTKEYFHPLGIEVGLRTIRQGLNYKKILKKQKSDENLVLNNFILHKILPKMTFDWKKRLDGEKTKEDLFLEFVKVLENNIDENLITSKSINVIEEFNKMIESARANDGIVNYWA